MRGTLMCLVMQGSRCWTRILPLLQLRLPQLWAAKHSNRRVQHLRMNLTPRPQVCQMEQHHTLHITWKQAGLIRHRTGKRPQSVLVEQAHKQLPHLLSERLLRMSGPTSQIRRVTVGAFMGGIPANALCCLGAQATCQICCVVPSLK